MDYNKFTTFVKAYSRIYCEECGVPVCWSLNYKNTTVICNNCENDEWNLLRFLKIVTNLFRDTEIDLKRIDDRREKSNNVLRTINNFNVLKNDSNYKLNLERYNE